MENTHIYIYIYTLYMIERLENFKYKYVVVTFLLKIRGICLNDFDCVSTCMYIFVHICSHCIIYWFKKVQWDFGLEVAPEMNKLI